MMIPRKFVQISMYAIPTITGPSMTMLAIADDGTAWLKIRPSESEEWARIDDLPSRESPPNQPPPSVSHLCDK